MAALIKKDLGVDATLVVGGRGEFSVMVGDAKVAAKSSSGFPADGDIVTAVRKALGRNS